ncbi:Coenzyme Q (ubiquinone) biosynthesis protein Coq4 [Enhygromyxa salina]|uniref:Coenzyme Q (Ubiquinone) biosynthesis protein Coq4 n=1 Tax=Enhygromyxa salina TaxID=215803 RepID=A0A2S9XK56_9BACT|nr:Coq4 family protein [Enhygromyxa salina]PRP93232.1 Coenzyme Q (ubiquinone) biosynthesis protein Coq4 [Enhygromyxa salina]
MDERDIHRIRWRDGLEDLVYLYRHPEDTGRITRVIEAWQGRSLPRTLTRMRARAKGRDLLRRKPSLGDALADWDRLERLPAGTLGAAYLDSCAQLGTTRRGMSDYVETGTSAERTAALEPDERFLQDTLFFSHDLYHLVTGYQTDLLGEVCLLAFTAAQTRNTGVLAMAGLGAYSIRLPRLAGQRRMLDASARALRAEWLVEQDWPSLLARPLTAVQRELGLWPPPVYEPVWVGKAARARAKGGA